nr:NADH dehydrogenase subunit 11 [Microheliella maris]
MEIQNEIELITIYINSKEIKVPKNITILQACEMANVLVPRFCFHERLSIAGNCRMCLVEVKGSRKLLASCAIPVANNMEIFTESPVVKKAREGVLEFLLINHPLDCPICDQGGECDLQDQAMVYGSDRSRFQEYKRAVEDKNCGPLIKTIMTRCIHCTRCIRFASEVAGTEDLGTTGRGNDTEVGTYIQKTLTSELSGNLVDLCPVGALTSKPYSFTTRPWELNNIESIDILDSIGSNIRLDVRGTELMRILPRLNENINEEWITDKARYAFDGLKYQRILTPLNNIQKSDPYPISWKEAFQKIENEFLVKNEKKKFKNLIIVSGNLIDLETGLLLKNLANLSGSNNLYHEKDMLGNSDIEINNFTKTTLPDFETIDFCLLIGINPRLELPLLNTRLRKAYLNNNLKICQIGNPSNLTFPVKHIGNSIETLVQILEGRHKICSTFKKAKNPIIIIGSEFRQNIKNIDLLDTLKNSIFTKYISNLLDISNIYNNVANANLNLIGGFNNFSIKRLTNVKNSLIYLYDCSDLPINLLKQLQKQNNFIIYHGSHGNNIVHYADIVLPGTTYVEKDATFSNFEGRLQSTKQAIPKPEHSRTDWKIVEALIQYLKLRKDNLKFTNINQIKEYFTLYNPRLQTVNTLPIKFYITKGSNKIKLKQNLFQSSIENYYMTDNISKSSKIMAQCTTRQLNNYKN